MEDYTSLIIFNIDESLFCFHILGTFLYIFNTFSTIISQAETNVTVGSELTPNILAI